MPPTADELHSEVQSDTAMKMSERLVLAQWSLLLALGVVLALALRPLHLAKGGHCENSSRYDVVLTAGVGNSTVPVVTQAHLVQAPCTPPYSMKVMSYRLGSKDENGFVLHIQLLGPGEKDESEDLAKATPPHWFRSSYERDVEPDFRMSNTHRGRQLTIYHDPRSYDYIYDPYPEPTTPAETHYNRLPSQETKSKVVTPPPAAQAQIPPPPPASPTPTSTPSSPSSNSVIRSHDSHPKRSDTTSAKTDNAERRKPYADGDEHWRTYSTGKPFMVLPAKKRSPHN